MASGTLERKNRKIANRTAAFCRAALIRVKARIELSTEDGVASVSLEEVKREGRYVPKKIIAILRESRMWG